MKPVRLVAPSFSKPRFLNRSYNLIVPTIHPSESIAGVPNNTPRQLGAWALLLLCAGFLWAPALAALWPMWRSDDSLSHGPLIPCVAAGLLWVRRNELREWKAACAPGIILLALCSFVFILSVWADIEYLKPLSLIGMTAGVVWFLGGLTALRAAAGPLGLLIFMIPWPITVIEKVAFPLQLLSSAYAALFGGLLGLPIVREGVQLAVVPNPEAAPSYSILVAQKCSGLTSLTVLLTLAYLIAYHTPVRIGLKALLIAAVVPLALLMNAVRLTIILYAGAHHGRSLAEWIHHHETPMLVFLCSLGLMGLRHVLLLWTARRQIDREGDAVVQVPASPG